MRAAEFGLAQAYKEGAAAEFTGACFLVRKILFKRARRPEGSFKNVIIRLVGLFPG